MNLLDNVENWQPEMGETPEVAGAAGAGEDEDTSSAAPTRPRRQAPPAHARSVNDQRVITYMRNKIIELESKLKVAELELERWRSRGKTEIELRIYHKNFSQKDNRAKSYARFRSDERRVGKECRL